MRTNGTSLTLEERQDMMEKILAVAQDRLLQHKLRGVKFKQIATATGLPKTRVSEIFKRVYISKKALSLLIEHQYLDFTDIEAAGLTDAQLVAVRAFTGQV